MHINPETSAQKIRAANRVNISRYVSTPEEYDEEVVSREDVKKTKHIVKVMIAKTS